MIVGIDGHDLEGKRTGVGWYLMNILRAWKTHGVLAEHQCHVFFKDEMPKDLPSGVHAEVLPRTLFDRSLRRGLRQASTALFTHVALPKAAQRRKADVLFCPGYTAPLFWKKPFVLTLHDIVYEARPELFNWRSSADYVLLKWVSKHVAKRAAHVLTPSAFSAQEIERLYRIPREKVTITPLAAEKSFAPLADQSVVKKAAQQYGVSNRLIFFVGSMFTRRHIPELIAAFQKIARDFPDLQFLLSGANRTRPFVDVDALIQQCNKLLGRNAVIHVQYIPQDDLPMLYNAASMTVWISEYEGFALPPLESLACGTPVLTTENTCMRDTVGEHAYFVDDPSDVEEIAEGMRVLLTDQRRTEELRAGGLQYVKRFSWDRCAQQTWQALEKAIK